MYVTMNGVVLVLCAQICMICSAPLKLHYQQPLQNFLPAQQTQSLNQRQYLHQLQSLQSPQSLQLPQSVQLPQSLEQMFAMQQLQGLQNLFNIQSGVSMNPQGPLLIILPNTLPQSALKINTQIQRLNENIKETNNKQANHGFEDEESDSIVIDAVEDPKPEPQKALLLLPNNRGIVGDFISTLPFLPIEINVPDSISWFYNAISSAVSGIGQRLPFRPQTPETMQDQGNLRLNLEQLQKKPGSLPILVMPLGLQAFPLQI